MAQNGHGERADQRVSGGPGGGPTVSGAEGGRVGSLPGTRDLGRVGGYFDRARQRLEYGRAGSGGTQGLGLPDHAADPASYEAYDYGRDVERVASMDYRGGTEGVGMHDHRAGGGGVEVFDPTGDPIVARDRAARPAPARAAQPAERQNARYGGYMLGGDRYDDRTDFDRAREGVSGPDVMHRRRWRSSLRAGDVMTRAPRTVRPDDPVRHLARLMVEEDTGILPVATEDGRLLGVVTDRDIVCRLVARGADPETARARDAMTDEVECVTERDDLHEVLHVMAEHQIRRVCVVGPGDRLVGIVSMADIARRADLDEELQDTFARISSGRGFWSRLR